MMTTGRRIGSTVHGSARTSVAVMVAIVSLAGCVGEVEEPVADQLGTGGSAISSDNALSVNSLSANRLSANRLSANRLSANRLSANKLMLNTSASGGMEQTTSGREVLKYMARCALPVGTTLIASGYSFPGLLGLAPGWTTTPMTSTERHLVSGCLAAHTNYYGISVPISVRWDATLDDSEGATYYYGDAAFFGDYFSGQLYACKLDNPPYIGSIDADLRICDDGSAYCGFTYIGACSTMCQTWNESRSAPARKTYGNCWTSFGANGVRYAEVVNVYLRGETIY